MTLDEAIKHCEEVAEESEYSAIMFKQKKEASAFLEKAEAEKAENDCQQCAADHRQLAEWLVELKERRAIGVQNAKRGEWEEIEDFDGDSHYGCTACGAEFYLEAGTPSDNEYYYCPHCGAEMMMEG